ncbi:LytTR family DNA-binding domain-containing protein [Aquimarina litoralis]|uniref:LytTR family DNA-binding domain-containing protein n=1 Tax=Aquimarina litoralis TaxID=584605 RepID=UPI001C564207|nr:LytTR family DNA-binding domain-containing protein [Aquimarina litoralis]MBW1296708.1 tetratricopeptide repeat protein [Aquimarina litoralis]
MTKRLAILPLQTRSTNIKFLVPIIQEVFISNISAEASYVVISKDSANVSSEASSDLNIIAKQLKVNSLVTGNLIEDDDFIIVKLEYQNLKKGKQREVTFEVDKSNLFKLGEISLMHLKKMLRISVDEVTIKVNSKIQNPEIHQLYVLGNYHFNRWTQGNVSLAVEYYEKVITAVPDFAPAYLKLAKCLVFQAGRGYELPKSVYPKARAWINKALEINPNSGEAIIDKNLIDFFYELDWTNIYNSIEKGLENYVDASEAYQQLSFFWYGLKEYDASLDALYSALEFDPISTSILNMIGDVQLSAKRYDDSEKTFLSILKMIPNDNSSLENLMYIAALQGNERKAITYYNKLKKALPSKLEFTPRMGYLYGRFGMDKEAELYLRYFKDLAQKEPKRVLHNYFAQVYSGRNDWEQVMNHIERGWKARSGILFIITDPQLTPLYKWKRYQQLVSEIKLPKDVEDNNYVTLYTDIKETFRINLNTLLFVKAEDNYTRLYFFQNFRLEEKLIRATMKTVSSQLPEHFSRIHKSYIINMHQPFKVFGNAKTRYVTQNHHDIEIPVSRSFNVSAFAKS